ncbi:MAG: site-2 protease family protein [Massiliimalia sp.]|jgi:regulator of sigma E protease
MWVVLLTILVFGVIICIHEFGHFAAAKLSGVKVNEFSMGMGPKLFSFRKGETQYSVRLLPIGGYVSMEGEDESSQDERAFCNKSVWRRFLIVVAGAVMNLVLGFVVLVGVFATQDYIATNRVAYFEEDAVSVNSGLQIGDEILKIGDTAIYTDNDIVLALLNGGDSTVDIVVRRNGEKVTLDDVQFMTQPSEVEGQKDQLYIDFKVAAEDNSVWNTISYSARRT